MWSQCGGFSGWLTCSKRALSALKEACDEPRSDCEDANALSAGFAHHTSPISWILPALRKVKHIACVQAGQLQWSLANSTREVEQLFSNQYSKPK